jgi:hypothetical protein
MQGQEECHACTNVAAHQRKLHYDTASTNDKAQSNTAGCIIIHLNSTPAQKMRRVLYSYHPDAPEKQNDDAPACKFVVLPLYLLC